MALQELMDLVRESRYPLEAFIFVQRGLDFTVRNTHGEPEEATTGSPDTSAPPGASPPDRHVSGQQLCQGLRDFALAEYGLLAGTVLRRWRICRSEDFGRIVFAMVDAGLMHKTDHDTIDDFVDVFDFGKAFGETPALS